MNNLSPSSSIHHSHPHPIDLSALDETGDHPLSQATAAILSHPCDSQASVVDEAENIRRTQNLLKLKGFLIRGTLQAQVNNGKKDKTACVRENLQFLQDAVPALLRARRFDQSQLLEAVKRTINADVYQTPAAIEGGVERSSDGRLVSKHRVIQAVLDFVETKFPGQLARLPISEKTHLSLPLEPDILAKARQFENGCRVRQISVIDEDEPLLVDIDLGAYSARQAIKQGTLAFTPDATLSLNAAESASAEGSDHSGANHSRPLSAEPHPFAFLQQVKYTVSSNDPALAALVERALNEHDAATLELRGRLGAHALQRVFTQSHFDWKLGAAMLLSVAGSGGIAYALDMQATARMIDELAKKWGHDDVRTRFVAALAESLVPTPAEIFDSSIVKRIIEKLRGNGLLPESWQDFKDDFKDALIAGLISAVGSLPSNLLQVSKHIATLPFNLLTNSVATATAAAMAPLEVAHAEDELAAGVLAQRHAQFFAAPTHQIDGDHTQPEALKTLVRDLHSELKGALEATPGINQTINSMGIGQVISLTAGFVPFNALARTGAVSEMVQKIAMIAVNQPTEVLSLATGILTGKHIGGIGALMTTDTEKNNRIAALILQKAQQRVANKANQRADQSLEISEDELRAIEHPSLELTFKGGRLITQLMNDTVTLFSNTVAKLKGSEPEHSLTERVAAKVLADAHPPV